MAALFMFHTHTMVALLCGLLCLFYLQQVQQGRNMPELMHVCVRACAVRVRACSHHESFLCLQKNTDFVHFWLGSKSSFTLKKKCPLNNLAFVWKSIMLYFQHSDISECQNRPGDEIKLCSQETLLHILCISICACE